MAKNNNEKKQRTIRTDQEVAFEHARKLMGYCVKVARWDWVEQLTPMLKEMGGQAADNSPQVSIPGTE